MPQSARLLHCGRLQKPIWEGLKCGSLGFGGGALRGPEMYADSFPLWVYNMEIAGIILRTPSSTRVTRFGVCWLEFGVQGSSRTIYCKVGIVNASALRQEMIVTQTPDE